MKTWKPTSGFCAETRSNNGHGSWQSLSAWVSAQPAPTCHCLSFLSPPSPPSPSSPSSFPPLYCSILPLQLFWLPTTYTPTHTHTLTHPPSPNFSFSQQGSSGHCSLSTHPQPPHNTHPHTTTTTSSTPPHPLFLSERMFQPLHTDSSGILCVEMFLLDPQALTIYRTKASAPLLKAWHL